MATEKRQYRRHDDFNTTHSGRRPGRLACTVEEFRRRRRVVTFCRQSAPCPWRWEQLRLRRNRAPSPALVPVSDGDRGVRLCWCPPGRFSMGSSPTETGHRPDEAQVTVTLTRGFWMGAFEVTQGEWKRIVGRSRPGTHGRVRARRRLPGVLGELRDAETFCRRLTELARRSGAVAAEYEFRLPTEAQWEYACRAGTATAFAFGDGLGVIRPTSRRQRSAAPRRSAATRRMPGESSTCTATFSSGAATGTTLAFPEAPIRICTRSEGRRIGMARLARPPRRRLE